MKTHLSGPLVLTVWLCLSVMQSAAALPPERSGLPNFDRRAGGVAVAAAGERQASVSALRAEVAGAGIDFNEVAGGPKWVRSRDGYLSGPGGEGKGISAAVAAGFAADDPHRAVKAFVQEHQALFGYGPEVLASARVYRDYVTPYNGMKTTLWQQELDGIEVYEAVFAAHTTKRGELIGISSQFLANPAAAADAGVTGYASRSQPIITAQQAVVNAAGSLEEPVDLAGVKAMGNGATGAEQRQQFSAGPFNQAIEVRLVWLPMNPKQMRLCWEVALTSHARGETYRLLVDAQTGEVQVRRCLTVYLSEATYRVYTNDSPSPFSPGWPTPNSGQPALTSRVLVTWSALDTNASPNGWIDDGVNETRGNNVDAHTDRDANNVPDLPRPQGSPYRVFDCPMDLGQSPTTYTNAAVVQLFYWCNFMHDKLYELGFTEAAGNFQNNNFGRGGLGNDALQADAQDGSGYNNANFTPTPDGTAPRIQMYLFNGPTPDRDGDFDAEVVLHEYTHGLSERLVGGGVGISELQTGGMGEGWSDWYAMAVLSEAGDDENGVYASGAYVTYMLSEMTQNYYFGIRRYPYCTDMSKNPLTFKDIDPAQASGHSGIPRSPIINNTADEVHNMGEVWCMTLREARANLINKYGWAVGNPLIMQLVTDGMKLGPANPNFLQARDAILQADLVDTGGANRSELWTAFAKRGMGFSATSPSSSTTVGLHEAYDIPDDLRISPTDGFASSGPVGGPFTPNSITLTLTNAGSNSLSWTLANPATWLNVSPASGTLNPGGPATSVTASLTASASSLPMGVYNSTVWFTNLNDQVVQGRQFTLRVGQPDYYTELFTTANDMSFKTFTFTPDGSANFYSVCQQPAAAFPTDPTGGTLLSLTDDSYSSVTLSGGNTVAIYGTRSGVLYIGSNGYLTMNSGDTTFTELLSAHFSLPRVSGLFDDLNPGAGGTISWKQLSDRVVVTYQNVPEYGTADINSFQMDLFYDGRIRLTCLEIDATDGLAGLSAGTGVPVNFQESDFSTYGVCTMVSLQLPVSATEGSGVLTNVGTVWIGSVLPTNLVVSLTSSLPSRLTVPASTTITAGQLHSTFNLTVVDNSIHDGDQTVTVTAGAPGLGNASASMLIIDDDVPPQILIQPSGQTAPVGNSASFSVTATGKAPLGYFWRRNSTPIAGANASSYTTNNVQLTDSGSQFSCLVSNAYGSVLSSNALLTVITGAVDLITFDDLTDTTSGLDVPVGYHGLTWNNFSELNGLAFSTPSGYQYGVVSASNVAFNVFGGSASMTMDSPFTLVSAYLTAAWTPNLQVRVTGYAGGVLTYDQTYTLSATVPTLVTFNYGGVTEVDFSGLGGSDTTFVMDNMAVLTGNPLPSNNVPVITGFSPVSGLPGINVTIFGTNFSPVLSNNIVYFGAVRAVVTAASVTNLVVTVPVGATYAPITETVNGMTAYANTPFLPTFLGDGSSISSSSFAPRLDLPGGSGPWITAIADLDGDGKPDVVVANAYDGTISLFHNINTNGPLNSGSFVRVTLSVAGSAPNGLAVADVDGDGKLDVVVADDNNNQIVIFRNISTVGTLTTNSFAAPVAFSVGAVPRTVCVRDLDGDGRSDIACVCYGETNIYILRNVGVPGSLDTNSFTRQLVAVPRTTAVDLVVADLDGDGKPDMVPIMQVNSVPPLVSVFRNTSVPGTISFASPVGYAAGNESGAIIAGDVDGDGKMDLVIGWASGRAISVYRNLASPGSLNTNSFAPKVDFPSPGWVRGLGMGDLNGDGKPDISLVTQSSDIMAIFQNLSTPGGFTNTSLASRVDYAGGYNPQGVSVGDLNGDGRPDIVYGNMFGDYISIYQNVMPFGGVLPFITIQPTNQTVGVSGTASFSVTAGGSPPLNYQWRFGGTNISGATNTTLILTNVQVSQAGNYTVLVTNLYGSILSSNAVLTVTLDHFGWNPIPSPRFVNTPFAVTIRAQNPTNGVFTNFTGTAILGTTNGIAVTPSVSGNFVQGVWTGAVVISQTASNLVLRANDGSGHFGLANPINVISLPRLGMLHSGTIALYMWPVGYPGFVLETSDSILAPIAWTVVPYSPIQIGDQYLLPLDMTGTNGYYRLWFPGP